MQLLSHLRTLRGSVGRLRRDGRGSVRARVALQRRMKTKRHGCTGFEFHVRRSQVPSASAHSVEKETSQGSNTNVSLLDDTSRSVESNLNPARLGMSQVGDSVMTAEQSTETGFDSEPESDQNLLLGTVLVFTLVMEWILGAKVHQHFQRSIPHEDDFVGLVRYANMMLGYSVLLPGVWGWRAVSKHLMPEKDRDPPPQLLKQLGSAGAFAILYYVMGVLWMNSLPLTTLGMNTALYNTYVMVVFLLSLVMLKEKATLLKGLGVAGILAGSGVLGASTVGGGENTPLGVVLALTSAAMYAVYQVGFAKWIQDEVDTPDGLLEWTGAMGVSMLLAAPVLGAAGYNTGIVHEETLHLIIENKEVHTYLVASTGVVMTYMVLLLAAIQVSSPLFVSAGCVLTIPASFILDFLVEGKGASQAEMIGSALICISFLLFTLSATSDQEQTS